MSTNELDYNEIMSDARQLAADSARIKVLLEKFRNSQFTSQELCQIMERLNGSFVHITNLLEIFSAIQYSLLNEK